MLSKALASFDKLCYSAVTRKAWSTVKLTFVLHSPLELDYDNLASQIS